MNVVKGDASDAAGLTAVFSGAASAYIIVPGTEVRLRGGWEVFVCAGVGEGFAGCCWLPAPARVSLPVVLCFGAQDRTALGLATIEAAKAAHVGHIVLQVRTALWCGPLSPMRVRDLGWGTRTHVPVSVLDCAVCLHCGRRERPVWTPVSPSGAGAWRRAVSDGEGPVWVDGVGGVQEREKAGPFGIHPHESLFAACGCSCGYLLGTGIIAVVLLQAVKKSGIPYTIVRLPLFTDNIWCVGAEGAPRRRRLRM